MGATGVPLVVVSLNQAAGLVVPELTRSAGVKLNPRVSLHFRGWQLVIHSPGRCAPCPGPPNSQIGHFRPARGSSSERCKENQIHEKDPSR
jgi:hypothetical protein